MKIIRNFSWFFEIPIDREVSEKSRGCIFQVRFSGKSWTKKKFIVIELAKMMLHLFQIACSRHGCISFSPRLDRSITWRYRCAWTQLNKFSSWPQFWIKKSQNIFKNCLKACWATFSLKVLSTLNFLAYFFSLKMENENFANRNCYIKNY